MSHLRRAFTLVELLVVVGIIVLLFAMLMPSMKRARELANRTQCASNLRQIMVGAVLYAQTEGDGVLLPGRFYWREDSFEPLYPNYVPDLKLFVCPNTTNVVSTPQHLYNNADLGANDDRGGHSFEIRGWIWGWTLWPDGRLWTEDKVKNNRIFGDNSKICLVMDADDPWEGDQNNWPDPIDNHGVEGINVSFLDGHVEFVLTGRPLLEMYMNGYYNPSQPIQILNRHGLQQMGNSFSWMY